MYIAIDDTYGTKFDYDSSYISSNRRTNVAIAIPDNQVDHIREQIVGLLSYFREEHNIKVDEFHFADIYNRKAPWDKFVNGENLKLFEFFFDIYRYYRWEIFVQTLDDYSYKDHDLSIFKFKLKQLDLTKREHLSLFFLLNKVKFRYKPDLVPLRVYMDEGLGKPGESFAEDVFRNYPAPYTGTFESSSSEPLLQLADFVAFSINRSTHLYGKGKRSKIDNWFLSKFNEARFKCSDLASQTIDDIEKITTKDVDGVIVEDRKSKGLNS